MGFDPTGIIGAGAEVASTLINAKVARENTDKTISANRGLAEYQYSKDVEMWNKANAYNTPSAQMSRYKQAGINPNMIVNQGNAGNTATSLPKYQAPTVRYDYKPGFDPGSAIGAYQDASIKSAQADNLKAQRRILESKGVIEEAKAMYADVMEKLKYDQTVTKKQMQDIQYYTQWEGFSEYFTPLDDGTYRVKPQYRNQLIRTFSAKIDQPGATLAKTNADIAKINQLKDLYKIQTTLAPWKVGGEIAGKILQGVTSVAKGISPVQGSSSSPKFPMYDTSSGSKGLVKTTYSKYYH